jgi:dTDP-4-dehydrorhamnose reductase
MDTTALQRAATASGAPPGQELSTQSAIGRVFAGVLTYNRKETVALCLRALLAQTRPVDRIIVFDNGSTDGTRAFLEREGFLTDTSVSLKRIEENRGPAAGFSAIFEHAYSEGCDWLWVMDDDVIPAPDALEQLVNAYSANFSSPETIGFLSSYVRSPDGLPNNVPDVDNTQECFAPPQWAELLAQGMVRIKFSTFCSDLIPRSTIDRFGFPSGAFYYGGEDVDYSLRVARERPGYLVGKSVATHLRAVSGQFHILAEADPARIPLYFYYYRNQLYIKRAYLGRYALARFHVLGIYDALRALGRGAIGRKMAATVVRGLAAGWFFKPSYPTSPGGCKRST